MIKNCKIEQALTCVVDEKLLDIAKTLTSAQQRHIVVVEQNKPVGIISAVDIVEAYAAEKDLSTLQAADIMKSPIESVDIHQACEFALKIMMKHNTLSCPVTQEGNILGLVFYQDVFDNVCKEVNSQ